jgi:hypothetical protein
MYVCTYGFLLTGLELNAFNLFIYGGVMDVLWRQGNLMPTLQHTYYAALSPLLSFIWGGIPMMLILLS